MKYVNEPQSRDVSAGGRGLLVTSNHARQKPGWSREREATERLIAVGRPVFVPGGLATEQFTRANTKVPERRNFVRG
jgi:hypothetical protein